MGIMGFLLKSLSDDTLRTTERRMSKKLGSIKFDSKKHTRLDLRRIDVVNEISRRSAGKLPKRTHGWYLLKDD